jgi:hypothetical protein
VGISARETEVLTAMGERLSNAEIAARLFICCCASCRWMIDARWLGSGETSVLVRWARLALTPIAVAAVLPSSLTPFLGRVGAEHAMPGRRW